MAAVTVDTTQDTDVTFRVQQGIGLTLTQAYTFESAPLDIVDNFIIEMRTAYRQQGGTTLHTFTKTTTDENGYYSVDIPSATVTVRIKGALTDQFDINKTYYLEIRRLDADDDGVSGIISSFQARGEVIAS